jgi:hypothetical protein
VLDFSRLIEGEYHNLGMSPYGKNLTLLSVSNKGLHSLLDLDIRSRRAYESQTPARLGCLDFHQVVPDLVLKVMGIMCRSCIVIRGL